MINKYVIGFFSALQVCAVSGFPFSINYNNNHNK